MMETESLHYNPEHSYCDRGDLLINISNKQFSSIQVHFRTLGHARNDCKATLG